jgi:hypothetical protein
MMENLLFNYVRETSDHGPFNSWDRQAYLTDTRNGSSSYTPLYNNFHNNLCFVSPFRHPLNSFRKDVL